MKIFNTSQIRDWDAFTIQHEPIASIDLMERASRRFVEWFVEKFPDRKRAVHVFCGPGNNGGDGLAVARLLSQDHFEVKAYLLAISPNLSPDCETNLNRLKKERCCPIVKVEKGATMSRFTQGEVLIDAVFGSGLSRPVEGYWAGFLENLNRQPVSKVAIDIPSGMFADSPTAGVSFYADHTFSFERPKLGFVFPENHQRVGDWSFGSIGLDRKYEATHKSPYHLVTKQMVKSHLRKRKKYDHKGSFGHALLMVGSYGKMGAGVLAAKAALRSGVGLLTVHSPKCGYGILQTAVPEAMALMSGNEYQIEPSEIDFSKYNTIGIGCGIGTNDGTFKALEQLLEACHGPLVLDADALNLLAAHPELISQIPNSSILTPHPKEFERLFGKTADSFERNELQRKNASELGVFIVLKGANSAIACPDGQCYFNSTGNPGMATGGSGDVLTGIITGLLAQSYSPFEAAVIGVYLHGLAGDLAAQEMGEEALTAGDLPSFFGKAFLSIRE